MNVMKTSDMMYPLEAPHGWFLLKMEHQHTPIQYLGDTHMPLQHEHGSWYVEFQRYPTGGFMVSGRGHTMEEAWANAKEQVMMYGKQEEG